MAMQDRRKAREEATHPADREMQGHLQAALREIDRAMAVCGRITRSQDAADAPLAGRARQNRALLEVAKAQLGRVASLKSALEQDIDMLPEPMREELSREANLKRRVEREAQQRQRQTEVAVQSLLASLGKSPGQGQEEVAES